MIQGPYSRVYRRNRAHLKPTCYNGTSFYDHSVKKGEKRPKINSFQDPKPTKVKTMSFQMDTSNMDARSILFYQPGTHHTPPPSPSSSPQWLYSPRLPSFSSPAHTPSRESSIEPHSEDSSPTGRKRHQSEPAFIRPHDVDRGLTPGLSALLQEMLPLAPYKLERSAKVRARQAFSTMHWTPFKTPWRKIGNWCILTHFKTLTHTAKCDSFQDHHSGLYSKSSEIDSFQDPCDLSSNWLISKPYVHIQHNTVQIDSFQEPCIGLQCFHSPWETPFKTDCVRSSWEITFRKLVLSGPFHTVNPALISRPLHHIAQCFHSPWETSFRKLILSGQLYTVNFGFLSRPLWFIHHIQWMDSFQDHSEEEKKTEHTALQF